MTDEGTIHKDLTKEPGTKYIRNPSVPTKNQLHQSREDEKHSQALYFEQFVGVHRLGSRRVKDREDARLRYVGNASPGKTITAIKVERKDEMLSSLNQKYQRDFLGFGGYIPKYQIGEGDSKKWWKHQSGYKEDPNYTSNVEMREMKRHLAKPDQLRVYQYK